MKAITAQMDSTKKAYQEEIDGVLAAFEKSYQEMVDNERSLKAMMEKQKNEAIELSKIEVDYKPLQRAAEQNTKMYGLVASRQKEIDITGPIRSNNVRVLERAMVPSVPVRPRAAAEPHARSVAGPRYRRRRWRSSSRRSTTRSRRRRTSSSSWACRCWVSSRSSVRGQGPRRPGSRITCASGTSGYFSIRSRSRPSAAGRSGRTFCSCRPIGRCGRWSSPARAPRRARPPPRSTSASRWPRRGAVS